MAKSLTDADVEKEIKRLQKSEYVKLAKKEQQVKYRRRQYLYQLRSMEKHGKELAKAGFTMELLEQDEE